MKTTLLHEVAGQKTFALIFDKGDEVMSGLQAFAKEKNLAGTHFTGIGAFQDVVLGYFDVAKKDYKKIPVREQVEVVSLAGDITEGKEGKPQVHAHVVVGREDGSARAGHLIEAHVAPTLEVVLIEAPKHLRRKFDPESGLALIRL